MKGRYIRTKIYDSIVVAVHLSRWTYSLFRINFKSELRRLVTVNNIVETIDFAIRRARAAEVDFAVHRRCAVSIIINEIIVKERRLVRGIWIIKCGYVAQVRMITAG